MAEIIPTNTCPSTLDELKRSSEFIAKFAPWGQLDISDGKFTPVRSLPYGEGQWTELEGFSFSDHPKYEVHLMVQQPREIGTLLAKAGAKRILGHVETFSDPQEILGTLAEWKAAGAESGVALLFDTPLSFFEPVIPSCDVVQVMSIATLGRQGAPYEPRAVERVGELHTKYPHLTIEVDGGVSEKNIVDLVRAGARRFGVGSAIMKAEDPSAAYRRLCELAQNA